jgi:hypothetical protein
MRGSIGRGQIRIRRPRSTKHACHNVKAIVVGIYSFKHANTAVPIFLTPDINA